jgi:hypothetical protein
MIEKLWEAERQMVELIEEDEAWRTLDVTYHPPHVERVWRQWGDYRISLHRIYPCSREEALFHRHPWPSALYIADGAYEMAVGESFHLRLKPEMRLKLYEPTIENPSVRLILPAGSYYEMLNPDGYHYVRPLERPVMSVMLNGKPWSDEKGPDAERKELPSGARINILSYFRVHYHQRKLHNWLK